MAYYRSKLFLFVYLSILLITNAAKSYYDELQVQKSESDDQIKQSYRKLALKYHPDKNQGNDEATKKFAEINNGGGGQCLYPVTNILALPAPDKKWDTLNNRYKLKKRFDSGGFGEIWVASRVNSSSNETVDMFITKRIMVEKGKGVYLSGLREKYFGELFQHAKEEGLGLGHIARYVESLESSSHEIWVVFHHEGMSLLKLLYTSHDMGDGDDSHSTRSYVQHASNWWKWLKMTKAGRDEMRNLVWQLLMALKSCHDRKIIHRDIKLGDDNREMLQRNPKCERELQDQIVISERIVDFGSAVDDFTIKHLYGAGGPSRDEQTFDYMPPEALLNASWWHGSRTTAMKYDMWCVGLVILELTIGSPKVFEVDSLTLVLLDRRFEGWSEGYKELIYKLRSFTELCIMPTGTGKGKFSGVPALWKCSEDFFSRQIKRRDLLGIGFTDVWAMRLVRQLLIWDPEDRLTVDDALRHPYFSQHERPSRLHHF